MFTIQKSSSVYNTIESTRRIYMPKVITIGSATMDVFVECDEANIVSVCSKDKNADFMSYPYGSKIDISNFASNVGGGGINTACNFGNLGFDTSAIFEKAHSI